MENTRESPSAPRGRKRRASEEAPSAPTTAALAARTLRVENAPGNSYIAPVAIRYYWPNNGYRRRNGSPVYNAAAAADLAILERHVKKGLPAVTAFDHVTRVAATPITGEEKTMPIPASPPRHRIRKPMPHPSRISMDALLRLNDRFRHDPNLVIPGYVPPTVKTGDRSEYTLTTNRSPGSRGSVGDIHDLENEVPGADLAEEARKDVEGEQILMEIEEEEKEITEVVQPVLDRTGPTTRANMRFVLEVRERKPLAQEL